MKILKSILAVVMLIMVTLIGVVRWHHHDCNGNIFVGVSETADIVLGLSEEGTVEHTDHCHHHHSCENCFLKILDCFSSEKHGDFVLKHFALPVAEIPADLTPRMDAVYSGIREIVFKYFDRVKIPDFVSGMLSFRAPPFIFR